MAILLRPRQVLRALSTGGGDRILHRLGDVVRAFSTRGVDRSAIPRAFDWKLNKGIVTKIKNQGSLDACYAYAATTAVEYIHQIKRKEIVEVCVKEVLDAGVGKGTSGDPGGKSFEVLQWIAACGISREGDDQGDLITIDGMEGFPIKNEIQLEMCIFDNGPPVIAFYADRDFFYNEGEVHLCLESSNHDLVFTGWGTTQEGIHYWIAQNSYGEEFGDRGYVRIRRTGHPSSPLLWVPDGTCARGCHPLLI